MVPKAMKQLRSCASYQRLDSGLGRVQEYVRQMLLKKIIHESEQAALREQAASLLAASHPVAARPAGHLGRGFGQPSSGMKAFHQQHLQNQVLQVLLQHPSSSHAVLQTFHASHAVSELYSQAVCLWHVVGSLMLRQHCATADLWG